MATAEQNRAFIVLNEIVEVPGQQIYRKWKQTGRSLALRLLDDGAIDCTVTSGHVMLDASQRRELTEWLRAIP